MFTTASKFEKETLKICGRISRSLEHAECGNSMLSFCKEWQRNEQRIKACVGTQPLYSFPYTLWTLRYTLRRGNSTATLAVRD